MRIYSLDLLRFIAAFAVLLYHYLFRAPVHLQRPELATEAGQWVKYGYLGVDVFFLISGFVILMTAQKRTPLGFFQSRVERLVPSYLLAVLITFPVLYFIGPNIFHVGVQDFLINLTNLNLTPANLVLNAKHVDEPYWTLAVEVLFYILIWGLLMVRLMPQIKAVLLSWLGIVAVLTLLPGLPVPEIVRYLLIEPYAAYFVAGALFYLARQAGRFDLPTIAGLGVAFVVSAVKATQRAQVFSADIGTALNPAVIVIVLGAMFAYLAALALGKTGKFEHPRWLAWGALTYPLYLLHDGLGRTWIAQTAATLGPLGSALSAAALALALGWVVTTYWDIPAGRWLRAQWGKRAQQVQARLP